MRHETQESYSKVFEALALFLMRHETQENYAKETPALSRRGIQLVSKLGNNEDGWL
jgi:hypothetical protein